MNLLDSMDELLKRPDAALSRSPYRLFVVALICYAAYAVAAGLFQGGSAVALAVLKVPMIIIGSVLLCVPSLYVFTALAGAESSRERFVAALGGFCGTAGLVLVGLMPIVWLFSVSTLSLGFVVWLHVFVWLIALVLARGLLIRAAPTARPVIGLWLILLFVVSLQMTTHLRPVLWRDADEPLFQSEKKSFFTHLHEVVTWTPARTTAAK